MTEPSSSCMRRRACRMPCRTIHAAMRLTNRNQRSHVQLFVRFQAQTPPSHQFDTRWPAGTAKAPHVAARPSSLARRLVYRVSHAPLDIFPCLYFCVFAKMDESARGGLHYLVVTSNRAIIITLVLHLNAAKLTLHDLAIAQRGSYVLSLFGPPCVVVHARHWLSAASIGPMNCRFHDSCQAQGHLKPELAGNLAH